MIEQLLDVTRIRLGGGLVLDRKRIDLARLSRRTLGEIRTAHPNAKIDLDISGDERRKLQ